jgi:hypothetical protein
MSESTTASTEIATVNLDTPRASTDPKLNGNHGPYRLSLYGIGLARSARPIRDIITLTNMTPELIEALRTETNWINQEGLREIEMPLREQIGLKQVTCPVCNDRGFYTTLHHGETSGQIVYYPLTCDCQLLFRFYQRWSGIRAMADPAYRWVQAYKVLPTTKSNLEMDYQEKVIALIKRKPFESYLICGPSGTSKSVFCTLMFRLALQDWAHSFEDTEAVWHVSASQLADEFLRFETGREIRYSANFDPERTIQPSEPTVTDRRVRYAASKGLVPRVFIEEIDKLNMTEARQRWLFSIFDAVYACGGQLVVTSNLSEPNLEKHLGVSFGEAFLRRVTDREGADPDNPTRGRSLNFFKHYRKHANPKK